MKSHISLNVCDRGPVTRNIWFNICHGSRSIRSASSRRGRQVEVSSSRASRRRCAACAVVSAIGMAACAFVSAIGMAARVNAPQAGARAGDKGCRACAAFSEGCSWRRRGLGMVALARTGPKTSTSARLVLSRKFKFIENRQLRASRTCASFRLAARSELSIVRPATAARGKASLDVCSRVNPGQSACQSVYEYMPSLWVFESVWVYMAWPGPGGGLCWRLALLKPSSCKLSSAA